MNTAAPDYLRLLKGGSFYRMVRLRDRAAQRGKTWRDVRDWGFHNWESAFATLSGGMQGKTPIWYTHAGPEFRDERQAHEIIPSLARGWYTDADCNETAIGIVARLPHGRFIAGYVWTSNDERVYFPDVFDNEREAAYRADSHAERFAEDAREDDERFRAMSNAEDERDAARDELRELLPARNVSARLRARVRAAVEAYRAARLACDEAKQAYERG